MPIPAWRSVARWILVLPVTAASFMAAYVAMELLFALTAHGVSALDASGLNLPVAALLSAQGILAIYVASAVWLVPTTWAIGFALGVRSRTSCVFGFAIALLPSGAYVWASRGPANNVLARAAVFVSAVILISALLLFWRRPAHRKLYAFAVPFALLVLLTPTLASIANAPKAPPNPQRLWSATLQNGTWNGMNTGSEFSATRQMVIVENRLIAVYDAGFAPYQGKQPMSNYRLVSLDLQTGQLRNENTFVGKWGAMPQLYATLEDKVIVANGSLRELGLDLAETGKHFDIAHGRIDQISPDGSTMAWETFPGVELVDTSTLAILPIHIAASIAGSVSQNSILTDNINWVNKYPTDHYFVTQIDNQGEHLIFHDKCSGGAQFLSEQRIFLAGCGKIRVLDPNGKILHESALRGNPGFAGVSRNGKRFAVVVSDSQGDPLVVLYEHFFIFDTETGQSIAMIRSPSLPARQSWSAFSADGNLFAAGAPGKITLYRLSNAPPS